MSTRSDSILILSSYFYPHTGGSQRYMEELYAHLIRQHPDMRVDVLTYNTDHAPAQEIHRGMTVYRIPCIELLRGQFVLPNPFALIRILMRLKSNRYHWVHAHVRFFDVTWWGWFYARVIGAGSIVTSHIAHHPVHASSFVTVIAGFVDTVMSKLVLPRYDHIHVTNEAAKRFVTSMIGTGKPITVTYGGVDTAYFSPSGHKPATRTIPNTNRTVDAKTTIITYAGRMIWSKGVTYLYQAAKELLSDRSDIVFVLAGPGDLEDDLASRAAADGIDGRMIFTGNLTMQQTRDLLRISDIFIHPSHHTEGFPNVILEAGACGAYVIATDNAGTTEALSSPHFGTVIRQKDTTQIRDAIIDALTHPKRRATAAREFRMSIVKRFDWKAIAKQFYPTVQ